MSDSTPLDASPRPRSAIPVPKSAMSSRLRSSSGSSLLPQPSPIATRVRPRSSVIVPSSPSHASHSPSPISPSPSSPRPSPYTQPAQLPKPAQPQRVQKPLQQRKPSLMIERPAVRFSADPVASSSPQSAVSAASSPSPRPPSPPSPPSPTTPSGPTDGPPEDSLDLASLTLPPLHRPSSRAQSLTLSPQEVSHLREPSPAPTRPMTRHRDHSYSVSSFTSVSSSGSDTPLSVSSSLGSTAPLSRPPTAGSENIRVIVRCRPTLAHEVARGNPNYLTYSGQGGLTVDYKNKKKSFTFDTVFPPPTTQAALYADAAAELIDAALQGYNGTIFAYGQTGSGKSHTMMGALDVDEDAGLIPRAITHIFACIDREVEESQDAGLHVHYSVSVSFLEIYNEKAGDLLVEERHDLEIREHEGTFFAPTLTRTEVTTRDELIDLLRVGNERRNVAATVQNSRSSRSHTILTLYLEKRGGEEGRPGPYGPGAVHFVQGQPGRPGRQ